MNPTQSTRLKNPAANPLTWFLLVAFLIATVAVAYLTYISVRDFVAEWKLTQGEGIPVSPDDSQPVSTPNALGTPAEESEEIIPSVPEAGPEPKPWDGASRVTILLMGLDYGAWSVERKCPCRTDTMILLTYDPLTRSAGILNIPRDLWVSIPGADQYYKINQAYFLGQLWNLPDGGPGLAVDTVEQFLGVPITFYAQIDFKAFEKFINAIGGIELDIKEKITVDPLGEGNTRVLKPGKQTLRGPIALA